MGEGDMGQVSGRGDSDEDKDRDRRQGQETEMGTEIKSGAGRGTEAGCQIEGTEMGDGDRDRLRA